MTALLSIQHLNLQIGDTLVCEDLNLQLEPQSCWGLLGANGVGKTSLLHTIAGLRQGDKGTILLHEQVVEQIPRQQLAKQLGQLLQMEENGFPATVLESVLAGRHPHLSRWGWETEQDLLIVQQAIEAFALSGMQQRSIHSLSGGERRRVDMATLLTQQPLLALLDEPGNHLDPGQQITCLDLLTQYFQQSGHGMIMALHDINLATRYCDHLLLLQGNGNWLAGSIEEIATVENISQLYQHPMSRMDGPSGPVFMAQ